MKEEAHLECHFLIAGGVVLAMLHEDGLIVPVLEREEIVNETQNLEMRI